MPRWAPWQDRLIAYIDKSADGCWRFTGPISSSGYGRMYRDGRPVGAHRLAYTAWVGPIPEGLQLDHLCRVRHCVNPEHLEPVTNAENARRGISGEVNGGRQRSKTHCPHGHEYAEANTYVYEGSKRECRTCHRQREAARRAALGAGGGHVLKSHCKNGHAFTPDNTYLRADGARACRQCVKAAGIRYRTRRRLAQPDEGAP